MALISCPECQHQMSDKAPTCPHCGAPMAAPSSPVQPPPSAPPAAKNESKKKTSPATWVVLLLIIAGAVWYFQSPAFREQNLPPMPVDVGYRKAFVGPGLVLTVKNKSDRHLSLRATLKNPSLTQEKTYRLDVPPKGAAEVGHKEGWVLASGDLITLSHNDYKSWNGSIP